MVPRVIAFEPDRENFARLPHNIALNDLREGRGARGRRWRAGGNGDVGAVRRGKPRHVADRPGGRQAMPTRSPSSRSMTLCRSAGSTIAIKIDVEGYEDRS